MDSAFVDRQIDLRIEQVEIKNESPLVGKTLVDFRIRKDTGVVVLALRKADGRFEFNPPPEALIDAGDYLIVVGASEHLVKLERILES